MKKKLCCIFNYAPLYRKSIFTKIDEEYDAQFYFGDMVSDIAKMDYGDFKKYPKTVRDRKVLGKMLWRRDICLLPFKAYDSFLIIGDMSLSYFFFMILCRLWGKKVYAWGHGDKAFKGRSRHYVKWFYKHCDGFFTYGEGGKARLVELGIPEDKLHVIYNSLNNGVDPIAQAVYNSTIVNEHFNNGLPTVVFVGRLTKVKRLDWIIDAQDHHFKKGIKYNVLIIGDGKEADSLRELAASKHLDDHIWFYGECYDDEKLSVLLYNSDLCVSPGNVGLTALHSMIYGTPVISHSDFETQMPEYEVIMPGKTGDLYDKDDFNDFCLCIERWLSSGYDRDSVRQNCYNVINDKYNSDYQIRLLKQIIR